MSENRRRVIRVSKAIFETILRGVPYGYTSSLPKDIEVIQVLETDRLAARSSEFRIVVHSETFEPVEEGLAIPEITPSFTRIESELEQEVAKRFNQESKRRETEEAEAKKAL